MSSAPKFCNCGHLLAEAQPFSIKEILEIRDEALAAERERLRKVLDGVIALQDNGYDAFYVRGMVECARTLKKELAPQEAK